MLGREYFERVLLEQIRGAETSVTVSVQLEEKDAVEVWRVFAAHAEFVIFEIHPPTENPSWVKGMPWKDRWSFNQLAVPYENISRTMVMTGLPKEGEVGEPAKPIGFHVEDGNPPPNHLA